MLRKVLNKILPVLLLTGVLTAQAAALTLNDFSGNVSGLKQYTGKGKWTIVMLWASDCLICNKEAPHYNDFHNKHKDKDAIVLGISLDGKANIKAARKFIQDHKLDFPNLLGEAEDIAVFFYDSTGEQWAGTPTILIYSPQGKLTVQQIGAVPVPLLEQFLTQQAAGK